MVASQVAMSVVANMLYNAQQTLDPSYGIYRKTSTTSLRWAVPDEVVNTIIDGKLETTNKAKHDDVVAKGPKGEEYIISVNKAYDRYEIDKPLSNEYQSYRPIGFIVACQYHDDKELKFVAAWGEEMLLDKGSWIASTVSSSTSTKFDSKDVYRIDPIAFELSYVRVG